MRKSTYFFRDTISVNPVIPTACRLSDKLSLLAKEISRNTYRPLPLLKILVDKGNGESRTLSVPAVRDRVAQASALIFLEPLFEAEYEHCSYAYRKDHSWQQAVQKVREYYDQGYRLQKVESLIQDRELCRFIRLWVKAEVWDGMKISILAKGIPQGSAISPALANLYLDELDEELLSQGLRLVRYADDFVILCKTKEKARSAKELTEAVLKQM